MRSLIALLTLVFVCNHTGLYQWLLDDCCLGMDDCAPSMHCASPNCPGCVKTPLIMNMPASEVPVLVIILMLASLLFRPGWPRLIWRPPQ